MKLTIVGNSKDYSREKNLVVSNSSLVMLISIPVAMTYGVIHLLAKEKALCMVSLVTVASFSLSYYLNCKKWHSLARALFLISANLSIFSVADSVGKISSVYLYYLASTTVPFLIYEFREKVQLYSMVSISFAGWLCSEFLSENFIFPAVANKEMFIPILPTITAPLIIILLIRHSQYMSSQLALENDLRNQELIHAAGMISLGEMAGNMAHEINNPLTVIQGNASMIRHELDKKPWDFEKLKRYLERIEKTSQRMSKIVCSLRMLTRQDLNPQMEDVYVTEILSSVTDLCSEKLKSRDIALKVKDIENILIRVHATQLTQVLLNLLSNSLDAVERYEEKWIEIKGYSLSGNYVFEVIDSGPGLPAEVADKIMSPFFTTKEKGKGTGLGLPISKKIMCSHGGDIYLDRKSPKTKFIVTLPISENKNKAS